MSICDLHAHSTWSDGTCTPAQLIALAKEAGLCALALTDHNTVAGLPDFLAAAEGSGIQPVPGVEFSTDYGDTELHILALFVQPEHYAPITRLLDDMLRRKEQSNRDLVEALAQAGIRLNYADIKAATPGGQVNRALIAAQMLRQGYVASVKEAFSQWLAPKHGYYHPPKRPDALETIAFIRQLGAVPVLAHPFLNLDQPRLEVFLPQAKAAGLVAMETMYAKYDPSTTEAAAVLAKRFDLLPSGGSDFHGENKPDIFLGVGRGNLQIGKKILQDLEIYCKENYKKV